MAKLSAILLFLALIFAAPVLAVDERVDINTADAAELARVLDGVGRSKADAIVAHREKFGPFTDVDELRYVKGIGAATVERNREKMTIGTTETIAER
ncbi:MAG: ComEA family DNA-binding protein [Gammaproteobacteria bacterium]